MEGTLRAIGGFSGGEHFLVLNDPRRGAGGQRWRGFRLSHCLWIFFHIRTQAFERAAERRRLYGGYCPVAAVVPTQLTI